MNYSYLVHADWSAACEKQRVAAARKIDGQWHLEKPALVGPPPAFLDDILRRAVGGSVLAGFDFPIGLPFAYGKKAGFSRFSQAIRTVGTGDWADFYRVAEKADEISLHRPFYPNVSRKGVRRADLEKGLGDIAFERLLRRCEQRCCDGPKASAIFWTLGGNQVGKAAINGWRTVIGPALEAGARLWPFDGDLAALGAKPGLVLAETYPAIAYKRVGAQFAAGESKRNQDHRRRKADAILHWAETHRIILTDALRETIKNGFGDTPKGEDQFDAFMGLTLMIETVSGRRAERVGPISDEQRAIEGWILGRHAQSQSKSKPKP